LGGYITSWAHHETKMKRTVLKMQLKYLIVYNILSQMMLQNTRVYKEALRDNALKLL